MAIPKTLEECIGKLVRFTMPTVNGPKVRAGTGTRIRQHGELEVRLQMGGYIDLKLSEIIEIK